MFEAFETRKKIKNNRLIIKGIELQKNNILIY